MKPLFILFNIAAYLVRILLWFIFDEKCALGLTSTVGDLDPACVREDNFPLAHALLPAVLFGVSSILFAVFGVRAYMALSYVPIELQIRSSKMTELSILTWFCTALFSMRSVALVLACFENSSHLQGDATLTTTYYFGGEILPMLGIFWVRGCVAGIHG